MQQPLAFGIIKLSVLFVYRRIFRGKTFDIVSKVMLGILTVWTIGYFFASVFVCKTAFWAIWGNLEQYLAHCGQTTSLPESLAISDVILDVMVLSIPIPMVG